MYQAYNDEIADAAVRAQCFVAPWRADRMTWIKPSAAWMGYRAGWASKKGQEHRTREMGTTMRTATMKTTMPMVGWNYLQERAWLQVQR